MKKYEEYQPSAVEWLDKVPAHWKSIKLKFLFEGWMGGSWGNDPTGDENDLICVRVADFDFGNRTLKRKDFTVRNFTPSEQASRLLQKGDLILEKSGGGEKTPVGRVVKFDLDEPAICSNFTNRLIPKAAYDSDFLIYLFFALYNNGVTVSHINQTTGIQNLQVGSFLDETVFIPTSIPEQRAIAAYLDHKTAQLDTLLAQKETLLQKLHQKRQALINEAVTQGLDPAAPRKPSGVAWLGDVPAHWQVKKLKYVMDFFNTVRVPLSAEERGLMTNPVYDYYGASGAIDKVDNYHFDGDYILLAEDGANLLSRSSPLAFKATGKFWVNNHAHILRPKDGNLDYYINLLESLDYAVYVTGSAQPKLSMGNLANVSLPVPPVQEQNEIQNYLHTVSSQLMSVENKIHTQIKTLKSYRQSLISEVVTGKVDVRPAVPAAAVGQQTVLFG